MDEACAALTWMDSVSNDMKTDTQFTNTIIVSGHGHNQGLNFHHHMQFQVIFAPSSNKVISIYHCERN